jgi:hypothetical protein
MGLEPAKNISQIMRSIERIRAGSEQLDGVLAMFAKEARLLDVATVIASLSGLDPDYGFGIVTQGHTQSVLILLRALDVGWPTAKLVLKLRLDKFGESLCGPMVDEADYLAMDIAAAQRVIRFLKSGGPCSRRSAPRNSTRPFDRAACICTPVCSAVTSGRPTRRR